MTHLYKRLNGTDRIYSNEKEWPKRIPNAIDLGYYNSVKGWFSSATSVEVHPNEVEKFKPILAQIILFGGCGKYDSMTRDEALNEGIIIPGECFEVKDGCVNGSAECNCGSRLSFMEDCGNYWKQAFFLLPVSPPLPQDYCPTCGSKVKVSVDKEGSGCFIPQDQNESQDKLQQAKSILEDYTVLQDKYNSLLKVAEGLAAALEHTGLKWGYIQSAIKVWKDFDQGG